VIESPNHNEVLALSSLSAIEDLLTAWRARGQELAADPWIHHIIYFKNCGPGSGASLVHPHSQIVALPIVPQQVESHQQRARDYYTSRGHSVFHGMIQRIEDEMELGDSFSLPSQDCNASTVLDLANRNGSSSSSSISSRLVDLTDSFIAFIPFAAISPFFIRIVPRFESATFHSGLTDEYIPELACILKRCLQRLHVELDEPDFNLVVRSAPLPNRGSQCAFNSEATFRWHITINPRLGAGAMAGFEFGSGIFSNANLPEDDAAILRNVDLGTIA